MQWFKKNQEIKVLSGLDFNLNQSVIVVLQPSENNILLMHKIIISFEKCKDEESISQTLNIELKKNGLATFKNCVMAMPDYQVMTKLIQLDKNLSAYALDMLVWHEAEQQIGYPLTQINLDYQCLGASIIDSNLNDVLLLASQKKQVDERLKIVRHAGLNIKRLDVESYALARIIYKASNADPKNNIIAIIYLNNNHITLSVWSGYYRLFIRTETTNFKSNDSMMTIVKEIGRLLQLYYATHAATTISTLYMAGQYSEWCDLLTNVTQQFDIEVVLISSLLEKKYAFIISSEYVMAAALALSAYEY